MSRCICVQNKAVYDALAGRVDDGARGGVIFQVDIGGLPPTVNHLYRTSRGGGRYKTQEGKKWQRDASAIMRGAWKGAPYVWDVELCIDFFTADKRRWDIDNRVKALQDCLAMGGVLKDDRQVMRLIVQRRAYESTFSRVTVRAYVESEGQ